MPGRLNNCPADKCYRSVMAKKIQIILLFVLAILLSLIAFSQLTKLFFVSDEFLQLGTIRYYGQFAGLIDKPPLRLLLGDWRPLGTIITNTFLYFFQLNTLPFIMYIYVVHVLNIILAGILVYRLTKNLTITAVTAFCFALPTTGLQALSWLAAGVQTLGNQFFILLALHMALTGIEKRSLRYTVLAWAIGYIAFLFKETAFFVFILLAILPWLVKSKTSYLKKPIIILSACMALFSVGIYKLLPIFITGHGFQPDNVQKLLKIAWHLWYYPLVSLGQFFIPFRFLSRAGLTLLPFLYPHAIYINEFNYVGTVIIGDLISLLVSFSIIILTVILFFSNKPYRRIIIFLFVYYVLSFVPIAVYPADRGTSYIESRLLYIPFFAVAFLIGIIFDWVGTGLSRIIHKKFIVFGILYIIFAIFTYKQITIIQREVRQSVMYGTDIRETMTFLQQTITDIPDNPVFFIDSDRDYFYPNNKLPFQLGTGYMVMLTLESHPQIPKKLVGDAALAAYFQQGYLESNGKFFGYFWDRKSLKDAIGTYNILPGQIVGLYYHSDKKIFEDISDELRTEMN
jgi:hypothetical protein